MGQAQPTHRGARRAVDVFGLALVALVGLSAFLMVAPLFLDAFQCRSFIGMPTLGLGPKPMWVRPVACAFGSALTFLDAGFVGLVVASGWAIHARRRRLTVLALALTLAGAVWLFYGLGGPDLVQRVVTHLGRMI